MRRTLSLTAVLTTAASLLVTGVSSAEPGTTAPPAITWADCPKGVAADGVECGTLQVPLDYRDPHGRKIEIAISRIASKNPEQRRGVLLTNPGGPASGLSFPADLRDRLDMPQEVLDAYDIIGMDPRGVGRSSPVSCALTEEQQADGSIPPYAITPESVRQRATEVKQIAEQCLASPSAEALPHNTTANVARDLDSVRAALGERKVSYLGYSYGTYLGAVYSTLFPNRAERVVIDSSLGAQGWDIEATRAYGRGVEDTFPDFAKWAAAHPEHNLGATPEQVRAKYFELAERLDREPAQGVNGETFRLLTFVTLYRTTDASLKGLAAIWQALDADTPLPEGPETELPTPAEVDALISGRLHIVCADSRWPKSVKTYERNVETDRARHPMFGAAGANITPCAFWPDPVEQPVKLTSKGQRNILLVQNERDPATPLTLAHSMRRALGDRAAMITVDQGGHGAYLVGKNACANDKVTAYLLGGKRPAHDVRCAAETPAQDSAPAESGVIG
ncbi:MULTISPECIES: alpha/beta hydrolase [Actinosynnema]|uniref:alpha/beta hydrolase n=1 Tax=Actinosynnema TaxID=40566 RepID=UPI0020A3674E|nr:alpha/beta hydrolase [Actinosynnema pretiosum]MCP2096656.1 TAP-like protein [Actinosynnema pretiosum]